jgi:hypothetical protein
MVMNRLRLLSVVGLVGILARMRAVGTAPAFNLLKTARRAHRAAPDDHIVAPSQPCHQRHVYAHRLPSAAVGCDCAPRRCRPSWSQSRRRAAQSSSPRARDSKQEEPPAALFATADGQKFRAFAQRHCEPCRRSATWSPAQADSRLRPRLRRAATTPRPPVVAMPRAEAVPPLADEFGRLIGALHLFDAAGCGPS